MKILVFSDSHGEVSRMYYACLEHRPDAVIHLGDTVRDAEELERLLPGVSICMIRGNNDYAPSIPLQLVYPAGGTTVFLCHGHLFGVKTTKTVLAAAAKRAGCSVALFGHTHRPFDETVGDVRLINPGSVTFSDSYTVINADNGNFTATAIKL